MSVAEMLQECGGIDQVLQDMRSVKSSHVAFSEQHRDLTQEYANQWVAFHEGKRVAVGESLDAVFAETDSKSIPRGKMFVRFLDPVPTVMIL